MSWEPPQPPRNSLESIVAYWQAIVDIPESEPSAAILRDMAANRLAELGVASSRARDADAADEVRGPAQLG